MRPGAKLNLSISPGGHAHNRPELPQVGHVPGGRVTVGDAHIDEAEAPNPSHQVTLAAVWMGIFPVTNSEYAVYAKATGAPLPAAWQDPRFAAPAQPVVTVSWEDALGYCSWAGGRLPSEAEWEWCARGPDRRRYPWGNEPPTEHVAHLAQDWNLGGPSPVGSHPMGQGPFGHQDLAGNVWEWCMDAWVKDAHLVRGQHPGGIIRMDMPVRPLRGGCWRSIDCKVQAAYRNWFHKAARHITIGFRLCIPEALVAPSPSRWPGTSPEDMSS